MAKPKTVIGFVILVAVLGLIFFLSRDGELPEPTVITSDDGKASLEIPAGALPAGVSPEDISLTRVLAESMLGETSVGEIVAYKLEPEGLAFSTPAFLVAERAADFGENGSVALPVPLQITEEGAAVVDSTEYFVDYFGKTLTLRVPITHFSWYADTGSGGLRAELSLPGQAKYFIGDSLDVGFTIETNSPEGAKYLVRARGGGWGVELHQSYDFAKPFSVEPGSVIVASNIFSPTSWALAPKSIPSIGMYAANQKFTCVKAGSGNIGTNYDKGQVVRVKYGTIVETYHAETKKTTTEHQTVQARIWFYPRYGDNQRFQCLVKPKLEMEAPQGEVRIEGGILDGDLGY